MLDLGCLCGMVNPRGSRRYGCERESGKLGAESGGKVVFGCERGEEGRAEGHRSGALGFDRREEVRFLRCLSPVKA